MIQAATKRCSKCEETKPVTAFYANRTQCKACRAAYMGGYWRQVRKRGLTVRQIETTVIQTSGDPMQDAARAYRACRQHHDANAGRERSPYRGPVAADFLDAAAPDSSDRNAPDYRRWRQMADRVIATEKK